jgi:hypothetical protein
MAPSSTYGNRYISFEMLCAGKRRSIPFNIVLQIVIVASLAKLLREREISPLLEAGDFCPRTKWSRYSDAVVVDLITTSDPSLKVSQAYPVCRIPVNSSCRDAHYMKR